jgi:hypothetical protein
MGRLLDNLRAGGRFDTVVRDALNHSANEFVVLPTTDGHGGYERAVILPL